MSREAERTPDGRYVVVDGRRWRTADPALPDDVRARLLHHLGVARSGGGRLPGTTPPWPRPVRGCSSPSNRTSLPPTARKLAAGPCREAGKTALRDLQA